MIFCCWTMARISISCAERNIITFSRKNVAREDIRYEGGYIKIDDGFLGITNIAYGSSLEVKRADQLQHGMENQ